MRQLAVILLSLPLLVFACNSYEKENKQFKEELKMLREENDYLKAEIVGLRKELTQLSTKIKDERESLQKTMQEEREQLHKKLQEERELMQKRIQEATKKRNGLGKVYQMENGAVKRESKETGARPVQPRPPDAQAPIPKEFPTRGR
jgi:gas vesicle protein